jgi:hypothetical protein
LVVGRGRELAIADIFGSWERLYENFIYDTKYIIETAPSIKFGVEICDRFA